MKSFKFYITIWMIILFGYPLYRVWFYLIRKNIDNLLPAEPSVIAFWHRDIFIAIGIIRTMILPEKTAALVSPSQDGDYLSWILRRLGYRVIRGSASSHSVHALWESLRTLRDGYSLMITPDGPKGPAAQIKQGLMLLSTVSGKPVQLLRFNYSGSWRLKSWDGFVVPKPFSACSVSVSPLILLNKELYRSDSAVIKKHMEDFLNGYTSNSAMEKRLS